MCAVTGNPQFGARVPHFVLYSAAGPRGEDDGTNTPVPTYVIGDVQGCFATFERLLAQVRFDVSSDRLWLVGDLVNRGPQNLEMLRWVVRHERAVTTVLGNHDLHLIARHLGIVGPKRRDTLEDVLYAPDRERLVGWLRERPLLHRENGFVLVHAGLLPQWTASEAEGAAREIESLLRSARVVELIKAGWRGKARVWAPDLPELERVRVALYGLTQLRTCTPEGLPEPSFKEAPEQAPRGYLPWFEVPSRKSKDATIVFGHWAALGLHLGKGVIGLDTGAVWGNTLTAIRLEDRAIFQHPRV